MRTTPNPNTYVHVYVHNARRSSLWSPPSLNDSLRGLAPSSGPVVVLFVIIWNMKQRRVKLIQFNEEVDFNGVPLSSLLFSSTFFVAVVEDSRSLLASVVVVWCGRKGADTGRRLAVIVDPDVGDVTGEPVLAPPIALFRLFGRLIKTLPGAALLLLPLLLFTTVPVASTDVVAASGAASSNLNCNQEEITLFPKLLHLVHLHPTVYRC